MNTTKVIKCSCRSPFQDGQYGEGKRLHNVSQKKNENKKSASKKDEDTSSFSRSARCTVCGDVKN